ncbi:MAG TPA: glycine cleavage system aminomethyltransferase GcvT [Candidatus Omnitrophota bacterium]|nr:glycine cleavage system aminomethyltransferase GcvT [Candidatus Omnitrophota bacterium]
MNMSLSEVKKLPLHAEHERFRANFMEFAGWTVPLSYSSIVDEHDAVRKNVGVFDVSHMGKILAEGDRASDFLEWVFSNRLSKISCGQAIYGLLLNPEGGICDDVIVYKLAPNRYFMIVNAGTRERDWEWLNRNSDGGVRLTDQMDSLNILAVQGPKSPDVLSEVFQCDFHHCPSFSCREVVFRNEKILIGATGYTGERGFELFAPVGISTELFRAIFERGAPFSIRPIGFGARDTLRLEVKYLLYGQDMDTETTPLEAGLEWTCDFSKDFLGKQALLKQKENGILRKLVSFEIPKGGIARHGYEIRRKGEAVGRVTSGTFSPSLKKAIGLGYVPVDLSTIGSEFDVMIRERAVKARVVKAPFYRHAV